MEGYENGICDSLEKLRNFPCEVRCVRSRRGKGTDERGRRTLGRQSEIELTPALEPCFTQLVSSEC